jgi:hypothetical protein
MNWKLIFQLSMFGLAMAIATVYFIPSRIERFLWLAIFIVCAVIIAKRQTGRPFLHGLFVSLLNSVWITSAHVLLFDSYIASHPEEAAMMQGVPIPPKLMMLCIGPLVGLVSGIVLGFFAWVASKLVKREQPTPAST